MFRNDDDDYDGDTNVLIHKDYSFVFRFKQAVRRIEANQWDTDAWELLVNEAKYNGGGGMTYREVLRCVVCLCVAFFSFVWSTGGSTLPQLVLYNSVSRRQQGATWRVFF